MAVTQVIKTLGNVLEGMKTIIDNWLSTNITNPSSPHLDRSLSLANAAAPADLVGDLKTNIDKIDDKAPVIVESVSGDVVSFDDGAEDMPLKKCLIQIEPVQDLHGQEYPYPAGGGKNKYSGQSTVVVNNQLFANIDIDPIPAGIYTISAIIGTAPVTGVSCRISFRKSDGTAIEAVSLPYTANTRTSVYFTLSDTCTKIYFYYAETTSGTGNQTFVDVQIEPGTAMTDYAPYTNICPISGWTGVTAYRTGKNLFDPDAYTVSGISPVYSTTGNALEGTRSGIYIELPPGTYTMSQNNLSTAYATGNVLDSNNEFVSFFRLSTTSLSDAKTFTVEEGQKLCIYKGTTTSGSLKLAENQFMLEVGSEGHDYEEYSGTTIPVVFPVEAGTVYGGTFDPTTGILIVDRVLVDMGTLNWQVAGDRFAVWTSLVPNPISNSSWNVDNPIGISSIYPYGNVTNGNGIDKVFGFYNGLLYARDTAYDNPSDFKTSLSNSQLVYKVATPITYYLTPEEIKTLFQNNNIWSDIGPVSVDYCADTKTYIDNKIAEIVNG